MTTLNPYGCLKFLVRKLMKNLHIKKVLAFFELVCKKTNYGQIRRNKHHTLAPHLS